jgi:1-aminocyclopropane-1-carboxylate deaminase
MDLHLDLNLNIATQSIHAQIDVLRLDNLHAVISGNKYFKLVKAFESIITQKKEGLLTFGGYYSNHIAAAAAMGHLLQIPTIGVVNGAAILPTNPTLLQAAKHGMQLIYTQRQLFHEQASSSHLAHWQSLYPHYYIVPAGGANEQGIVGCMQILKMATNSKAYTHIACSVGTGTTLIGIANSAASGQLVVGFAPFKKDAIMEKYIAQHAINNNWQIKYDYHMGGFSKYPPALLQFINETLQKHNLPLDKVYTAKMLTGIYHLIESGTWNSQVKVLMIHSGGLQGN